MRAAARAGLVLAPFVLFTAAWALLVSVTRWPEDVLPSPFMVGQAFADVIAKGILPNYTAETIRRILIASVTGAAIGIVAGFVMGLNDWMASLLIPTLQPSHMARSAHARRPVRSTVHTYPFSVRYASNASLHVRNPPTPA